MSFFTRPPVRQEGFAPTNNNQGAPNDDSAFNDLFNMPAHTFIADGPTSRKFSSGTPGGPLDFGEELASLMGDRSPAPGPLPPPSSAGGAFGSHGSAHSHSLSHSYSHDGMHSEDRYAGTHNIFDISAPGHPHHTYQGTGSTANGAGSSNGANGAAGNDYPHTHTNFNSTLPALNSSMRYEPHADSPNGGATRSTPSPGAGNGNGAANGASNSNANPHSPLLSPSNALASALSAAHLGAASGGSRASRSRSRPPLNTAISESLRSTHGGPARTTRTRRTGSVSGTSPPPVGGFGRTGAVGIPRGNGLGGGMGGGDWFVGGSSFSPSASEYSLPTPSDHHNQHHFQQQQQQQYNSFSLPPDHHSLPPLHMPGSPYGGALGSGLGSPGGVGSNSSGKPIDFGLAAGGHAMSLPKSPLAMEGFGMPFGSSSHGHGHSHSHSHSHSHTSHGHGHGHSLSLSGGFGAGSLSTSVPGLGSGASALLPITASVSARSASNGGIGVGASGSPPSATSPASASSTVNGASGLSGSTVAANGGVDKQSLLANEKRRRRRESHNAVERRRRDNINEKISELATLIPECMLDGTGGPNGVAANGTGNANGANNGSNSPVSPGVGEDALLPSSITGEKKEAKEDADGEGGVVKANKGMILRKSVEYIRYLQQLVTAQGARNRELEQALRAYRGGSSGGGSEAGTGDGGMPGAGTGSPDGDENRADEMMLHDDGMDFSAGGMTGFGSGSMLPSMPEGDDELELEMGMDVDGTRGRTRGIKGQRLNGSQMANGNVPLKEEVQDDDLGFMHSVQA